MSAVIQNLKTISLVLIALPLFGACSSDERNSAPTEKYQPLPEAGVRSPREIIVFKRRDFEYTREFLQKIVQNDGPDQMRDSALHIGQALSALRMLEDGTPLEKQRPVLLLAAAILSMDDEPLLGLTWVNPNRETFRFHFLLRGPDKEVVYMDVEDTVVAKTPTYLSRWWGLDLVSWDSFKKLATASEDGVLRINIGHVARIPYPRVDGLHACAAIEDRTGRMSGYLPFGPLIGYRSIEEGPLSANLDGTTRDGQKTGSRSDSNKEP